MSANPNTTPTRTSGALEWVKVLIWPLLAFACLIAFWQPLKEIGELVPNMLTRSDEISIGSIKLKMTLPSSADLAANTPPSVKAALAALSPGTVRYLIDQPLLTGELYSADPLQGNEKQHVEELVERGLCTFKTADELRKFEREKFEREGGSTLTFAYGLSCGYAYQQAREFLLGAVIPEFIARLQKPLVPDIKRGK